MSATTTRPTIAIDGLEFTLRGELGPFAAELTAEELTPGLHHLRLTLRADAPSVPTGLVLAAALPISDSHHAWTSAGNRHSFGLALNAKVTARACSQAPVLCLHSLGDRNRCTLALDDGLHRSTLQAFAREEDATHRIEVRVFEQALPAGEVFALTLRVDRRELPYHRALGEVAAWWAAQPGYEPAPVPAIGTLPMYSTWYSFHQTVPADLVEAECARAKALGCHAVIMDDGWQTLDDHRGYAYTGDWEPERIPDIADHVARVHALGLKYLLWYSVPFVGYRAACYQRFAGMALRRDDRLQCIVLDPRFPAVREYLIGHYERALREWDVDGLKLDFVDSFGGEPDATGGRDIADVDEAADRLLSDAIDRLRAIKPEVLIEFRQSYIGPKMRRYGNLHRAGDCPYCPTENRKRTLDIRLLAGPTAVHSDMFRWHADEAVDSAALQLLAVLFSVPQVSVRLDELPEDHRAMLRFWLAWWTERRGTLLDGSLDPRRPDLTYPVVVAEGAGRTIAACYGEQVLRLVGAEAVLEVVNATRSEGVVLELACDLGQRQLVIRDCCGRVVAEEAIALGAGLHKLAIPASGVAELR